MTSFELVDLATYNFDPGEPLVTQERGGHRWAGQLWSSPTPGAPGLLVVIDAALPVTPAAPTLACPHYIQASWTDRGVWQV